MLLSNAILLAEWIFFGEGERLFYCLFLIGNLSSRFLLLFIRVGHEIHLRIDVFIHRRLFRFAAGLPE